MMLRHQINLMIIFLGIFTSAFADWDHPCDDIRKDYDCRRTALHRALYGLQGNQTYELSICCGTPRSAVFLQLRSSFFRKATNRDFRGVEDLVCDAFICKPSLRKNISLRLNYRKRELNEDVSVSLRRYQLDSMLTKRGINFTEVCEVAYLQRTLFEIVFSLGKKPKKRKQKNMELLKDEVPTKWRKCAECSIHEAYSNSYFTPWKSVCISDKSELRNMSYELSEIFIETRAKQAWQVPALAVHIQGLSGDSVEELQAQLREIILATGLPIDRDMAQCIFEDRIKAGSAKTGMKSAADVFSTHTYASCIIPLKEVCLFAANPVLSRNLIAEEKEVFPTVHWIADCGLLQIHAKEKARFIVQPWVAKSEEVVVVAHLMVTSWLDATCLSDVYATISMALAKTLTHEVYQKTIIIAERLRLSSRQGSMRPWAFTVLTTKTGQQLATKAIILRELKKHLTHEDVVNMGGYMMRLISSADDKLTEKLAWSLELPAAKRSYWVVLNGTVAPALTYVLDMLDCINIDMGHVVSINHTTSSGKKKDMLLALPDNVVVKFNRKTTAIRLIQYWYNLDCMTKMSPSSMVLTEYDPQVFELDKCIQEERLEMRRELKFSEVYVREEIVGAGPSSLFAYPSHLWPEALRARAHVSTPHNPHNSASKPASVKRRVNELEMERNAENNSINRQAELMSVETELFDQLEQVMLSSFRAAPMKAMVRIATVSNKMINNIIEHYSGNRIAAERDADVINELATILRCPQIIELVRGTQESRSEAAEMDYVGGAGNDSDAINIIDALSNGSIEHNAKASADTLGFGACGYATLCLAIMHYWEEVDEVDPRVYQQNKQLLLEHLALLLACRVVCRSLYLASKLHEALHMLMLDDWQSVFRESKHKWLTMSDMIELLRIFSIPHRCWLGTNEGFKCTSDFTFDETDRCYNIMYWNGHFYLHNSLVKSVLMPEDMLAISLVGDIAGGALDSIAEDEDSPVHCTPYTVGDGDEYATSLAVSQMLLRDPSLGLIGPTIAIIPPRLRYQLLAGQTRVVSTNDMGHGAYNIPMDIELLNFYREHVKENRWLVVESRLVDVGFGIELKPSLVANTNLKKGTRVAPVVGTIEMCKRGDNAVWLHHLSEHPVNFYLNPSRVLHDVGYLMFADASRILNAEAPLNYSAFIRPAMVPTCCEANTIYTYTNTEDVVWMEVSRDVRDGEILWLPNVKEKFGWGEDLDSSSDAGSESMECMSTHDCQDKQQARGVEAMDSDDEMGEDMVYESVKSLYVLWLVHYTILLAGKAALLYFEAVFLIRYTDAYMLLIHYYLIYICYNIMMPLLTEPLYVCLTLAGWWYVMSVWAGERISNQAAREFGTKTLLVIEGNSSCNSISTRLGGSSRIINILVFAIIALLYTIINCKTRYTSAIRKVYDNCYVCAVMNALVRLIIGGTKNGNWQKGCQLGVEYSSNDAGDGPNFSELVEVPYEPTEYVEADENRIRVVFWNTNGHMVRDNADAVVSFVKHFRVDIIALSDVRLHPRAAKLRASEIRESIRGASVMNMSTTRSAEMRGGGDRMNTMGGTMFIIAPRCTTHIIDKKSDPSGLGIVGCVKLKINEKKLCVISMYKPIIQQQPGSSTVVYRLRSFLKKKKINKDPTAYIFDLVSHWIAVARRDGFSIIIGGDFNADPCLHTSVGNHLRNWASDLQLVNALRIRLPDGYLTHRCGGQEVSSIDHIYVHQDDELRVTSACVSADPEILAASDHNIIGIALSWPKFTMKAQALNHDEIVRPPRRIELPHYDKPRNEIYTDTMLEWFNLNTDELESMTASDGLLRVMTESVQVTRDLTSWKHKLSDNTGLRSSFKGGYSVLLCAIKAAYRLLLRYRYLLANARKAGTIRYMGDRLLTNFTRAYKVWRDRFPASDLRTNDTNSAAYDKTAEVMLAVTLENDISQHQLDIMVKRIQSLLHGRNRTEYRTNMNDRIAKIELLRQQKRIGAMFSMINLKDKPSVDLSTLTVDGLVISNAELIHAELTRKFEDWYRIPEGLHDEALRFCDKEHGQLLIQGAVEPRLDAHMDSSFKLQLFYEACRSKVSDWQREQIAEAILCPISENEYANEVYKMTHGKAPGPTGTTANMIKAWPREIHNQVLLWLNEIWDKKESPVWWNKAHLRPIPKSGEPSLENLRPLGLYEISRKILTAILIKRVYCMWEQLNLLNPNQHAFRRGLGTANAIIRLMNVAEDAEEWGTPLEVVLWDFRRAFDSIDFNFTRLALDRLGMPMEAIEFLTHMMENNEMWVASPHHLMEHANADSIACQGECFHQQRGTGQGDPPSPIIWIAVFDVLLTMLDMTNDTGLYYAHGRATEVYRVNDIAYADDLATISSSHDLQQNKADIVSTFCSCTGMTIAAAKIRAFQINSDSADKLGIHDNAWRNTWVETQTEQLLVKYLGFVLEHRFEDREAFIVTEQYLREAIIHIARCHASPQVKMEVYRMQIIPKIMYMAAKAAWSLTSYRKLDALVARLLKAIGGQMMTSSNQMMYFPSEECGSGLQPPSDLAQTRKWAELVGVLNSGTESALAANGLLERAVRQMSLNAPPTQRRTLQHNNMKYLKGNLNSLITWGAEVGCYLSHTPMYEYTPGNAPILPYISDKDTRVQRDLQMCDITVQGELTRRAHDGTTRWETTEMVSRIKQSIADHIIDSPDDEGIVMNSGQVYLVQDEYLEIIGKIHGTNPTQILCYRWRKDAKNTNILVRDTEISKSKCIREASVFQDVRRIVLRINNSRSTNKMLVARVISSTLCADPSEGIETMRVMPYEILQYAEAVKSSMEKYNVEYALYTDGSYQRRSLPWEAILQTASANQKMGEASAAVIAIACDKNWEKLPIHILYLGPAGQICDIHSYEAELIALMVAIHVAVIVPELRIYSDCQAAIETVELARSAESRKSRICHVRPIVNILRSFRHFPSFKWIRSHPESRTTNSDHWQMHDWGSFISDLAAKGQLSQLTNQFKTATDNVLSTPIDCVVQGLIPPGTWYWQQGNSTIPYLHSVIQLHSAQRSSKYFAARDADRANRGFEERWQGSSLALAARCWKTVASGALGSNIALKNCLDKYYHGRNRAKGLVGVEAQRMLQCHVCGKPDSQKHIILECECEGLQDIREETLDLVLDAATKELGKQAKSNVFITRMVRFILDNAFTTEYRHYDRLWTGLWNAEVLHDGLTYKALEGESFPNIMPFETIETLQNTIARISAPLTAALMNIMRTHRESGGEGDQDMMQQQQQAVSSCITDGLQIGLQQSILVNDARLDDALHDMEMVTKRNAKKKQGGKNTEVKNGGRRAKYGGKCLERRKKRNVNNNYHSELEEISSELSERCKIVVDSLVRSEGSVAESVSHPAGATRSRDYDRD